MKLKYKILGVLAVLGLIIASPLAFGSVAVPSGASAFPVTFASTPFPSVTEAFNELLILMNQQTVQSLRPASQLGNPLAESYSSALVPGTDFTSATAATVIASQAGVTLRPTQVSIMVSGTAATATGLALECSDGTLIISWPIAALVNLVPATEYQSTTSPALGAALSGKGCPASTAILLSNVGSTVTTTTKVYPNIIYSEQ